jgi:hypothetical protein
VEHIPMCEVMRVDYSLLILFCCGGRLFRGGNVPAAAEAKTFGVNGAALASGISSSLKFHAQSHPIMNLRSSATNFRKLSAS